MNEELLPTEYVDKETKPLMLSGEEIDAVIQANSRKKGLKL